MRGAMNCQTRFILRCFTIQKNGSVSGQLHEIFVELIPSSQSIVQCQVIPSANDDDSWHILGRLI